jgi:hypothetical protein
VERIVLEVGTIILDKSVVFIFGAQMSYNIKEIRYVYKPHPLPPPPPEHLYSVLNKCAVCDASLSRSMSGGTTQAVSH